MSSFLKASILLSLALLLGRLSGFVREAVLAARVGISEAADVAVLVLTLPDLLVVLLVSGGFSAVLVPAFRRSEVEERESLFRLFAVMSVLVFAALAGLLMISPGLVFQTLAPAMPEQVAASYHADIRLVALALPLAALSGVMGAYLQAREQFFVVGLGTLVLNLCVIIGLLSVFDADRNFGALALSVVLGICLRLAFIWAQARPTLVGPLSGFDPPLMIRFGSGVLATGIVALAPLIFRTLLSANGEGELASFAFALRLFELPNALLFSALITVLVPHLTDAAQGGTSDSTFFARAFWALVGLSLATLLVGIVFARPLAGLIYERGAMSAEGVERIVQLGSLMFLALPALAIRALSDAALHVEGRSVRALVNLAIALVISAVVALLGGVFVMAGFILFHILGAVLSLAATRPDLAALRAAFSLRAGVGFALLGLALLGWFLTGPADLSPLTGSLFAIIAWLVLMTLWWPMLRPVARIAKTR